MTENEFKKHEFRYNGAQTEAKFCQVIANLLIVKEQLEYKKSVMNGGSNNVIQSRQDEVLLLSLTGLHPI